MAHSSAFDVLPSSLPLPPVSPPAPNAYVEAVHVWQAAVVRTKYVIDEQIAQERTMKLAHLLLTILVNFLQNAPAATAASKRRLQLTAACANDEDSFYFNTTHTVGGVALGGCYARESGGGESHDVRVFTLNGDEQDDGDLVFFATASLTDDDDVLVSCST